MRIYLTTIRPIELVEVQKKKRVRKPRVPIVAEIPSAIPEPVSPKPNKYTMRLDEIYGHDFFDPVSVEHGKNQNDASRSIMIDMDPAVFLKLAIEGFEPSKLTNIENAIQSGAKLRDLPFLGFFHNGKGKAYACAHEGRHRARYLVSRGVTAMPVMLHAYESEGSKTIRWGRVNEPGYDYYYQVWPTVLYSEDRKFKIPFPVSRSSNLTESLNEILWHGSPDEFPLNEIRPLSHFGSKVSAIHRIGTKRAELSGGEPRAFTAGYLYPAYLDIRKPVTILDKSHLSHTPYVLTDMLYYDLNIITQEERKEILSKNCDASAIVDVLERHGYDGLEYKNSIEDPGHTSYVIFDAAQVRPAGKPERYLKTH